MNKVEAKRLVCRAVAQFMLHHDDVRAVGLPENSDRIETAWDELRHELERRADDTPKIIVDDWTTMWKSCPDCGGQIEGRELNDHPNMYYRCKAGCGWSKKVDGPDA